MLSAVYSHTADIAIGVSIVARDVAVYVAYGWLKGVRWVELYL